jgi:hypothetical protein
MLLQLFLQFINLLVVGAIAFFPEYTLPAGPALSALSAANIVLPLDVWSLTMGATVSVMGVGLLVWVVMKAINILRGSGA